MKNSLNTKVVIYQATNGAVEVRIDKEKETIFLTQQQVAELFGVKKAAISKHVKNIFTTLELDKKSTVSILETVQSEGGRSIKRKIEYYNLDLILSIGYRVNSVNATKFRQWATKTLRHHIVEGYTFNPKRLKQNYQKFLNAVDDVKKLLPPQSSFNAQDVLELVKAFADTWLSLDAYDRSAFPKSGIDKRQVEFTANELADSLKELKKQLQGKKEASELFAQERTEGSIQGIVGNVFQTVFGADAYPTIEEKAANLLYFIVKNHPFADGNKRSGAFAFVWFLNKAGLLDKSRLSPNALTVLTLLIAESNPKDKEKMIGLILQMLRK